MGISEFVFSLSFRALVYKDGCFDLMHYGHASALRQAKALGNELVVGVVSDGEIIVRKENILGDSFKYSKMI